MGGRTGGTKRSSWLTFRRRLLLVRLLLRGPASKADLIATVNAELGEQGYPGDAASALKHDFDALKAEYGCQISFRRGQGTYVLDDLGELALLDLPDESMEALSFLDASFPAGEVLPEQAAVRALIDRVLLLLPPYRQRQYRARRATSMLQLDPGRAIEPAVLRPRPSPPVYRLRYRLGPVVARRRDPAIYFADSQIEYHPDGSATVSATASNLWQARQILLRYGDACQVLDPPELVELFQATARGLGAIYLAEPRETGGGDQIAQVEPL